METGNVIPQISIIIPVYNTEKYLRKCIDSVINQNLKSIEIILVDDGSTDGSGIICDKYAETDKRIKVIHKVNQGLSCARNDGIDLSSAPYIMFVDSDDWVEPEYCELPYNTAIENSAEIVYFTYNMIDSGCRAVKRRLPIQTGNLNEDEALYFNVNFTSAVWIGLYDRHLFDKIRFPVGKYYEDVGTSHRLIHLSEKTILINEALYNYRVNRENSILTTASSQIHSDKSEMYSLKISDLNAWGYTEYACTLAFSELIRGGCRSEDHYYISLLRNSEKLALRCFNWKWRVLFHILKLSPKLFDLICIRMGKRKR